jgi:hypothetical protein
MRLLGIVLPALLLASPMANAGGVKFTVRDQPSRDWSVQGADDGRFEWLRTGGVAVELDSNEPSARLITRLPWTLGGDASFRLVMDFSIANVEASPEDFFQISLGLVNQATTGLNRTGTALDAPPWFVDDADTFDAVEMAYFPNLTSFGGPFLQPTVFGARAGDSAFWNFAANFGASSDLGDNTGTQVRELPQAAPLRFEMTHDACRRTLTTRIFALSHGRAEELETGIEPLDLSVLHATGTFHVDALAIAAYHDFADANPSTPSLIARLQVDGASIELLDPPSARLAPGAVHDRPSGVAHVFVDGVAAGDIRLVEIDGVPADEVLVAHAAGADRWRVDVGRDVASRPFVIEAGGCLLPVTPAR